MVDLMVGCPIGCDPGLAQEAADEPPECPEGAASKVGMTVRAAPRKYVWCLP